MIVYRHIRLDTNEVFYIGIGKSETRAYKKDGRNRIWNHIVNKTKYRVEIILEDLTVEEAENKEREFIKLYGRIDLKTGTLSNLTVGGESLLGKDNPMYGRGKTVEIDNVIFHCIKEAARVLGKHEKTIVYRLNSKGFPNYRKLFGENIEPKMTEEELKNFFYNKNRGDKNGMFGRTHSEKVKEEASKRSSKATVITNEEEEIKFTSIAKAAEFLKSKDETLRKYSNNKKKFKGYSIQIV